MINTASVAKVYRTYISCQMETIDSQFHSILFLLLSILFQDHCNKAHQESLAALFLTFQDTGVYGISSCVFSILPVNIWFDNTKNQLIFITIKDPISINYIAPCQN